MAMYGYTVHSGGNKRSQGQGTYSAIADMQLYYVPAGDVGVEFLGQMLPCHFWV